MERIISVLWEALTKLPLPLAIASGFLLSVPESILEVFGVAIIRADPNYRMLTGLVFIASTSILLSAYIEEQRKTRSEQTRVRGEQKRMLEGLTDVERVILEGYVAQGIKTRQFHLGKGDIRSLEAKKILFIVGEPNSGNFANFAISDWAYERLQAERKEGVDK